MLTSIDQSLRDTEQRLRAAHAAARRTSTMPRGLFAGIVAIVSLMNAPEASATDLGPLSGKGGGPFRIMCKPGDHVVGIDTRATHVIDFIAPVCGNRKNHPTATYGRPSAGGKAGTLRTPRCPAGAVMTVLHVFWDNTPLVNRVGFACWNIRNNQMTNSLPNYGGQAMQNKNLACPVGEVAVGIFGRAGTAIDALGLICEKWVAGGGQITGDASERVLPPEAHRWLNAHNNVRRLHCAPPLKWSQILAAAAKAYAQTCNTSHDQNRGNNIGENLAWGPGMTEDYAVSQQWYQGELPRYDFNNPLASYQLGLETRRKNPSDGSNDVGHFTQVVWQASREVGCGSHVCGDRIMHVCRYSPAGNFNALQPGVLEANVKRQCVQRRRPATR